MPKQELALEWRWFLGAEMAQFTKRREVLADDDVVQNVDTEDLARLGQLTRNPNVCVGGCGIHRGVVVCEDNRTSSGYDGWPEHFPGMYLD